MQSKKIIAGTMSLLMAFGSVAGTVGTAFGTAVMASAVEDDFNIPEADKDKTDVKLANAENAAKAEIDKIKNGDSTTKVETTGKTTLANVITAIVNRVNNLENGFRFSGKNVDDSEITPTSDANGTFAITQQDFGGQSGKISATIVFSADNKSFTLSFEIAPSAVPAEKTAEQVAAYVQTEMGKATVFTANPNSVNNGDVLKKMQELAASQNAKATVEITATEDSNTYTPKITFVVKIGDDISASKTVELLADTKAQADAYLAAVKTYTENADWIKEEFKNSMTEDAIKDSVLTRAKGTPAVDGVDDVSTDFDTVTVTPATDTAEGKVTAALYVKTTAIDATTSKNIEGYVNIEITIPKLPADYNQQAKDALAKVKAAVAAYKYKTSDKTTVDEIKKLVETEAAKYNSTVTFTGDFTKTDKNITVQFDFSYPNADKIAAGTGSDAGNASVTIMSIKDKAEAARDNKEGLKNSKGEAYTNLQGALDEYTATNDTTEQDVLDVLKQFADTYGVTFQFDSTKPFVKETAKGDKAGWLMGHITVPDSGVDVGNVDKKVIAAYSNPLEAAAAAVNEYLTKEATDTYAKFYVDWAGDSEISGDEFNAGLFFDEVKTKIKAVAPDVNVQLNSYKQVNASDSSDGAIIGDLTLSLYDAASNTTATKNIEFDVTLEYKTFEERLDEAVNELSDYLNNVDNKGLTPSDYTDEEIRNKVAEFVKKMKTPAAVRDWSQWQSVVFNKDYAISNNYYHAKYDFPKQYGNQYIAFTHDKDSKTIKGSVTVTSMEDWINYSKTIEFTIDYSVKNTNDLDEAEKVTKQFLSTYVPSNDAEAADVQSDITAKVKKALEDAGLSTVTPTWTTGTDDSFKYTAPTQTADGSVTGSLYLTDAAGNKRVVYVDLKVPRTLSVDEALKGAKEYVEAKLAEAKVNNDVTETEMVELAQAALNEYANNNGISGLTATKDTFDLTKATTEAEGAVKGTVTITYSGVSDTASYEVAIEKLTEEEPPVELTVGKVEESADFTSTTDAIRINWTRTQGADGYRIYVLDKSTNSYKTVKTLGKGSVNTYRISGLEAGTEYQYVVKAFIRDDEGNPIWGVKSDPIVAATDPVATTIKSNTATNNAVRIKWNAVAGADGYKVQVWDSDNQEWKTVKLTAKTEARFSGLKANKSYKYRVQAFKRVAGTKTYSKWSKSYTAKTKK